MRGTRYFSFIYNVIYNVKKYTELGGVVYTFNFSTQKAEADIPEFEASLSDRVSSRKGLSSKKPIHTHTLRQNKFNNKKH